MFNRLRRELIPAVVRKWRELKNREAGRSDLWNIALSRHYVVCGQMAPGKLRAYVDRLEMILVYYQRVLPSRRKPALDFVVRIYESGRDYVAETGSSGSAGLYLPARRELAIRSYGEKRDTIETTFHEATHEYINEYYKGYLSECHWYEEGIAEYFSTARLESGRIIKVGGKIRSRLDLVKNLLERGGRKLLGRLWRISYDDFYNGSQVSEHYALSWALVHFLMNTRNPVYQKAWRRFMLEQPKRDRKSSKKLFEETLGPLDLDRLFADLTQYVRGGM